MNVTAILKRAAMALILFIAVYAPAFGAVAWFHPSVQLAIPLIIVVSATLALLIICVLSRRPTGMAEFGLEQSASSYVLAALAGGVLIGAALAFAAALSPHPSPLDLSKLRPWMVFAYFVLAAPLQEELIFRGLLQTVIARSVPSSATGWITHLPVVLIALLFGAIHLDSGIVVATGALILGLVAGELRRLSGSLIPAMLFHAILNAASALWPAG